MKNCPNCNTTVNDEVAFCPTCGTNLAQPSYAQPQSQPQPQPQVNYAPPVDPFDHTKEFDPKDISENKVISMLVYLMGPIGIIIALLASNTSAYAGFHLRQALKFTVVEILAPIALLVGSIICIIPILGWIVYGLAALAYVVLSVTLIVLKFICFFQICSGKAKEPAIIRNLGFLK